MQPDAHMEARTRAGLDRLLMGGTPDQLDQAANSLLRSGYPLAAQLCAVKAVAMRRFDEERKTSAAQQDRARLHMQSAQAQMMAQAQQAEAIAQAAANMHALAAQAPLVAPALESGNVQGGLEAATVGGKVSPPGSVTVAPPNGAASGEAPLPRAVKSRTKAARKVSRKAAPAVAQHEAPPPEVQHVNGRARAGH